MHHKKGRKHKTHKHMKSLQDILAELQALDTTEVSELEAAIAQTVTDLQAVIAATPASADPVVSITTTLKSGATETFVPQA
jgi:hypothetical protein